LLFIYHLLKLFTGKEMIIHSILLSGTPRACGSGDYIVEGTL